MDHEFWHQQWKNETQGFQLQNAHHFLPRYWQKLIPQSRRILVPLCGKSFCLDFLLARKARQKTQGRSKQRTGVQHGPAEVWGVELSPVAVQRFFHERHWIPQITRHSKGSLWQRKNMTIFCGDYFRCSEAGFDVFYDRAALIALPEAVRRKYVQHTVKKLANKARGFLITLEYASDPADNVKDIHDDETKNAAAAGAQDEATTIRPVGMNGGPPFSLGKKEVAQLYEPYFTVRHITSENTDRSPGKEAREHLFLLDKL